VFFLLTGASGAGKSTVRSLVEEVLTPKVECAELGQVVPIPPVPDIAWRQRATEAAVRRALEAQERGRHFMLAGDPVAAGELVAAPSAERLDGIAVCLLDCQRDVQLRRLTERGDHPMYFDAHMGFADWMRGHVRDPQHMPHVIIDPGWEEMRWERWRSLQAGDPRWRFEEIDTTTLSPEEVAAEVVAWCRRALDGAGAQA
jgi:broad-specificity NMP kinase